MKSTRGPPGDECTQVGPMLAPWALLSGFSIDNVTGFICKLWPSKNKNEKQQWRKHHGSSDDESSKTEGIGTAIQWWMIFYKDIFWRSSVLAHQLLHAFVESLCLTIDPWSSHYMKGHGSADTNIFDKLLYYISILSDGAIGSNMYISIQ